LPIACSDGDRAETSKTEPERVEPKPALDRPGVASDASSVDRTGSADHTGPFEPNALGPRDAPVTLVEFSDFECPFSRRAARYLRSAVEKHSDKVRWVFKSFPLSFHPNARLAHEAALAAGEFDRFWEMHSKIYATDRPLSRDVLIELAGEVGIARGEFSDLLDSHYFAEQVEEELQEGLGLGVRGTPTILVNGRLVSGVQSPAVLDYLIREALGEEVEPPSSSSPELLAGNPETSHPLGFGALDASPLVKLFIDFRSPLGDRALPLVTQLLKRYGRQMRLIVKARPLGIYPDAGLVHEAAIAFQKRGIGFLTFWRRSLASRGKLTTRDLASWAAPFGLGSAAAEEIEAELRDGKHRSVVRADTNRARKLGITGVPTTILHGTRLDGVEGLESLLRALEARREKQALGNASAPLSLTAAPGAEPASNDRERCDDEKAGPPPESSIETTDRGRAITHDFGVVASGASFDYRIEIPNPETSPLRLVTQYASPSIEILERPKSIEAGGSGVVRLRVRTSEPGPAVFPLIFAKPGPDSSAPPVGRSLEPIVRLMLGGVISNAIEVRPAGGVFSRALVGEAISSSVHLSWPEGEDPEIGVLPSESSEVTASLESTGERSTRLTIRIPPQAEPARHRGTVRLGTNHPALSEIRVPYDVLVHGEVIVSPKSIDLSGEVSSSRRISLRSARGGGLAIRSVRSSVAGLRITPTNAPASPSHRLIVDTKGVAPGSTGEILILGALSTEEGETPIDVRVIVR